MRKYFSKRLFQEFHKNPKLILLLGDLGFSVFDDLRVSFPDRVINVGISEQNMMGIAAGLSSKGMDVIVYTIVNFAIFRALEQIRNDIIYHKLNIKICCVGSGYAYGVQGYTHLGVEDLAIMRIFDDNIDIYSPSHKDELKKTLKYFFKSSKASYLRLWRDNEKDLPYDEITNFYSSKNSYKKNLIITSGPVAQEIFNLKNSNFTHVNLFRLSNIPKKIFKKIFDVTGLKNIIFIEEHIEFGSLYNYYLTKSVEYNIKIKNLYKFHFKLTKYTRHGSHKYLRKKFEQNTMHIDKLLKKIN